MKTLLPFIPLYLFALIMLVLLLKSFISMLFPAKVKDPDLSVNLDESENVKLYKLFI